MKIYDDYLVVKDKKQFLLLVAVFRKLFDDFDTEHKMFKVLTERGMLKKDVRLQFVPPDKTLKNVFNLPNVYVDTINYIESLNSRNDNSVISNVIQTDLWREKVLLKPDEHVLPIYLYYDEYKTCNSLGAHAGVNKLGTIFSNTLFTSH